MKLKRIVSILLTLAIVLGLCPATFAADTIEVRSVAATVNGVAIGSSTDDITLTLDADANYDVYIDSIYKEKDDSWESFSGTFGLGNYEVVLHFTPKAGYTFAYEEDEYIDYTILGENIFVEIGAHQDESLLVVHVLYTFGIIDNISVQLDNVAAGIPVKRITPSVPFGAKYYSVVHAINKVVGESREPFSGTLEPGTTYEAVLHLMPGTGHTFADELLQHAIFCDYIVDSALTRQEPDLLEFVVEFYLPAPIHEVDLTVTGMEQGNSPSDVEVTVPAGSNYSVELIEFVDKNEEPFSGTFENDLHIAYIYLLSAEGCHFSEDMTVTVNGSAHHIYHIGEEMMVEYHLDLRTPIDEVEITVTGIEEGNSTADVEVTVPAGAKYTVAEVCLYDTDWEEFTGTFESDRYIADLYLEPAEGYCFTDDTVATVNGGDPYFTQIFNNGSLFNLEHHLDLRQFIEEVDISVTGLEEGKSTTDVKVTLPAGVNYVLDELHILDANGNNYTGTFAGGLYIASVSLKSVDGYCFPEYPDFNFHDNEPNGLDWNDQTVYLEYRLDLRTPIDEVEITVTGMEKGKSAADVKVTLPSGVNYTFKKMEIYDTNEAPFSGTFDVGLYNALIQLEPAEGYCFSRDLEFTVNGSSSQDFAVFSSGSILYAGYMLETRTPIDKVDITITGMEKGKSAANVKVTLPANVNYTLDDFYICDGDWEDFTGNFAANLYYADIYLEPAEGCYFPDDAVATINGGAPGFFDVRDNGTLNLEYHLELRTPITQVELPAWPTAPKAGDTVPAITQAAPQGKNYEYMGAWGIMDGTVKPGDKFANNTVYYYQYLLVAADGYAFTDTVTVTVGGKAYTGYAMNQRDSLYIIADYPIGNAKVIDKITLSGTFPTVGEQAGKVTSTGTGYTLENAYWGVSSSTDFDQIHNPTGPFRAGEYVYLALSIEAAADYSYDFDPQILFNGKAYSPIPEFSGMTPDGLTFVICLGQVRDGNSVPGDFTDDGLVTDADVIYLLWHTVFPTDYPIEGNADFNNDGLVTDADVIYLLWHTVFPGDYPL